MPFGGNRRFCEDSAEQVDSGRIIYLFRGFVAIKKFLIMRQHDY